MIISVFMADLKEREKQLRLYLKNVESQIKQFESTKKMLQELEDEIRGEITKHSISPTPINLKPSDSYDGDVYGDIQHHLLELNKLRNYISMKLKEVVQEEELLESLQSRFGEKIDFEKPKRGEFEIVYSDQRVKDAFDKLKAGQEKVKLIKDSLSEMRSQKNEPQEIEE